MGGPAERLATVKGSEVRTRQIDRGWIRSGAQTAARCAPQRRRAITFATFSMTMFDQDRVRI